MNLSSLEAVVLLLLFFLPGYVYELVWSKFEFNNKDNNEIETILDYLFISTICQTIALFLVLWTSHFNGLEIFRDINSLSNVLVNNSSKIGVQVFTAVMIAMLLALVSSFKPLKKKIASFIDQLGLSKYFNLGFHKVPPLTGAFDAYTNLGEYPLRAAIETRDGIIYEGNIKHIGYGNNDSDYLVVIERVRRKTNALSPVKSYPPDFKVLIPYPEIKYITFKEDLAEGQVLPIDTTEQKRTSAFTYAPSLLIIGLLIILINAQRYLDNSNFLHLITELTGAFVVTFLGVYYSSNLTHIQERAKEEKNNRKVFLTSLELLTSEMSLNLQTLENIELGIASMPKVPAQYYDSYGMLWATSKDISSKVFYSLISSGSLREIVTKDNLFNSCQQAYYNLTMTVNGIRTSREVHKDYDGANNIPTTVINDANTIVVKEHAKIKRTVILLKNALKLAINELKKYGVTFTIESDNQ